MGDKTWLEVEMEESISLLRKKLDEINDTNVEDLDSDDLHDMHRIYQTLDCIFEMQRTMKK